MITKSNLKNMLKSVGFSDTSKDKYEKNYPISDCSIIVDFRNEKIIYPEDKGFKVNVATTTNFSEPENFVVLECVNRLLDKGYRPENIELPVMMQQHSDMDVRMSPKEPGWLI